ncbi:hypothetical protein ACHAWU_009697 [Discostella pseudostelligera]|uniref:Uncharacterized protein n=1 Tax=Discostella pseudostelligera TaxID=259834 RepID=A0ABD3MPA8_9STRA
MSVVSVDGSNLSAVSVAVAVESSLGLSEDMNDVNPPGCRSESASLDVHQKFWLDHVPSFEPLKLCLDDSSTEGDEDMFDDDAFTFGDEDFQTLMSHDSMKRLSIKSQTPVAEMSADITAILSSHQPLHEEAAKEASKSNASMDSSSGTSSTSLVTLGWPTPTTSKTKTKRRVSLHHDVAVIPIPMRTEYPNRERIWCSASELYQNAARNTIEFASEGFNWRNVAADEQMVQMPSGERIHPIHFMNMANFCKILDCDKETPAKC